MYASLEREEVPTILLCLMPPACQSQIEARKMHLGKGLEFLCLSLALALSTIQVTVRFCSFPPQLEGENSGGCQGPPTSLHLLPNTRGLAARRLFRVSTKALYIYKHVRIQSLRHLSQHR
ncbi:hypothetical protein TNCV_137291 [Trichonephila clavipes]|nr:hypothetical protein TNCV_137291 [Trichonephila clavipes]